MRVGEAAARLIADYGVETVFGIPGVHNVELFRGLEERGTRLILPRHEQGAGFMADGYARASGRPAACFVITGPGLTNILTPMGQAESDSVPMLVVASALSRSDRGQARGRLHEAIDQLGAARSVVRHANWAPNAFAVAEQIHAAFAAFAAGRPRPAYLEIPLDLLREDAPEEDWAPRPVPAAPTAAPEVLTRAGVRLAGARRPLVIAGGGAVDAGVPLLALVDRLGAALITTVAAKGVVPESHPLNLGARLSDPAARDFMARADGVLAVGTELAETDIWRRRPLDFGGPVIRIDIDPAKLTDGHGAEIAILSDAAPALAGLAATPGEPDPAYRAEIAALKDSGDGGETPLRARHRAVLAALRRALPADAVIATDMTQIAYAGNEIFPVERPRCWLHPVGYGTLGYAAPAAIGAKLACPRRAVVALSGDYGLHYTLAELGVAAEQALPIPFVVWNNRALGQIRGDMVAKQMAPIGTSLQGPDFELVARGFGLAHARARSPAEVEATMGRALAATGPTLIELDEDDF